MHSSRQQQHATQTYQTSQIVGSELPIRVLEGDVLNIDLLWGASMVVIHRQSKCAMRVRVKIALRNRAIVLDFGCLSSILSPHPLVSETTLGY